MRNNLRGLAVLSAATLLTAGLATTVVATEPAQGQAQAADQKAAQRTAAIDHATEITVSAPMQRRLARVGVALKPVGAATVSTRHGRTVLRFPTSGTTEQGTTVLHKGGVVFKRSGVSLRLSRFRLDLNERSLVATVEGDARAEVLRVTPGPTGSDVISIRLNKLTAGMLDTQFDTHRFKAAQRVGSVQLPDELGSGSSFNETINIQNNSRYRLDLMSVDTHNKGKLTSTPAQSLAPSGRSGSDDTISYASNNVGGGEVTVNYLIHGTTLSIQGFFQVPTIGVNESACTQSSWVGFDECSIEHGYHPNATWIITTNTATGPFFDLGYQGEEWSFHKIGAPGSKKFQVNGESTDDGAVVSLWDANGQANFNWMWVPKSNGWGQLVNAYSKKCLEVNGTNGQIDQWHCADGADNQLWQPVWNPAGGSALQVKSSGSYLGTSADPGSVGNGTTLALSDTLNSRTSWGADPID